MATPSIVGLPCFCATLRRASRALTQRYDEALRPLGITITHFTILQALSLTGEVAQGRLGEILAMDSTTLTRTLAIMSKRGWVAARPGTDRRKRQLRLGEASREPVEFPAAALRSSAIQIMGSGLKSVPLPKLLECIRKTFELAAQGKLYLPTKVVPLSTVAESWEASGKPRLVFAVKQGA